MTTSRLLPKLFGGTPEDLREWAERIIVYFEQEIDSALTAGAPVGAIVDWPVANPTSAPDGWLLCNGAAIAIATYPALYAVLGTAFNTGGEGAGNFRLPNLTVTIGTVANCKRIIRYG